MFNYEAIRKACCEPNVDDLDRFVDVYSASRALAELASGRGLARTSLPLSQTVSYLMDSLEGPWIQKTLVLPSAC